MEDECRICRYFVSSLLTSLYSNTSVVWDAGEFMESSKFTDQLVNYQLITENLNPLCEMSCCE